MEPKKKTNKHFKGKKMNVDVHEDSTIIIIAKIVEYFRNVGEEPTQIIQLAPQLSLNKGLKKIGKKSRNVAHKELHEMHDRIVIKPENINSLTPQERKKDMESLKFLTKRGMDSKKGRICANGSAQRP